MISTTQPVYAVAEPPIGVRTFWKRANLGALEDAEGGRCVPLASEAKVGEACAEPACWWGRVSGRGEGGTERSAAGECGTALLGTAVSLLRFFACPGAESGARVALECEPLCEPEPREELACMPWRESRPAAGSRAAEAAEGAA